MEPINPNKLGDGRPHPIVGKSLAEAEAELAKSGLSLRVMKQDGESLMVTCDYCPKRLNVEVLNGIVIDVFNRG